MSPSWRYSLSVPLTHGKRYAWGHAQGLRTGEVYPLCIPIPNILFSRNEIRKTLITNPLTRGIELDMHQFQVSHSRSCSFFLFLYLWTNWRNIPCPLLAHSSKWGKLKKATQIPLCWVLKVPSASKLEPPNANKPLVNVWFQNSRVWDDMWSSWAQLLRNQTSSTVTVVVTQPRRGLFWCPDGMAHGSIA